MKFPAILAKERAVQGLIFILLFALAAGFAPLAAQSGGANSSAHPNVSPGKVTRAKKLILKDGSVQIVREYQVIGNRVRYYSVERADWEEIPASLVDWKATRAAAKQTDERARQAIALAHRVDLEEHPGRLDVDGGLASLGLPTGVLLPPGNGMFVFNGHTVVPLKTDLAKSDLDKGRFIAKLISPVPVIATRYTISLKGKRAKTEIPDSEPIFFYRTNNAVAQHLQLIRAKVKGNKREIAYLNEYMGHKQTDGHEIPLNIEPVDSDTYRLVAVQDLSPGEYALAQMMPATHTIDLYVWDFRINPSKQKPAKKKK